MSKQIKLASFMNEANLFVLAKQMERFRISLTG